MPTWKDISEEQRLELLHKRYVDRVSIPELSKETGIYAVSLARELQRLRKSLGGVPAVKNDSLKDEAVAPVITFPAQKPLPTNDELFRVLKNGPVSLAELSRKFDRSEATVEKMIADMEKAGYVIERTYDRVEVNTTRLPKVEYTPARTLADEQGETVRFGVISDTHIGSRYSQPSNLRRFIQQAYDEGIRHIFHVGDLTDGLFGYRGHNFDLVPGCDSPVRNMAYQGTHGQIWLADEYMPRYDDLTYYVLGGNHDFWHLNNAGIDAVDAFCKRRDDSVFLGYDVADIPLTDRVAVRMWHPSGGVPYSLSYRLQKGLEQLAFGELARAVEENDNPQVHFLLGGHLHVEVKMSFGPLQAALVGCFEGQTNYLKRKALVPAIGGAIWEVKLTDSGLIQRVNYSFLSFTEIIDDWKNYPIPEMEEPIGAATRVQPIFKLAF